MSISRPGKLPDVGTTVFTVMSRRAAEADAINLGQGFPDYAIDARLAELVQQAMAGGHNQYAPMPGLPVLLEQIALKIKRVFDVTVDAGSEITVTLGATEAVYSAIQAFAGAGEEVVVFDPAYDSYDPAVRLAGAHSVHLPLAPPALTTELRKVHQFNTFSIATCLQQAIASYLRERPQCGADLPLFFQKKRDQLSSLLEGSGLRVLRSAGSFFQLVDYSAVSDRDDVELASGLIDEAGVATIPLSVFYREPPPMKLIRLCFAKRDETLIEGASRLRAWAARQPGR